MKTHLTATAGLLALSVVGFVHPARAQTDPWCGIHAYDSAHPLAWENLRGEVEPLIDELEIVAAHDLIADRFEARLETLGASGESVTEVREALFFYQQRIREPGQEAPTIWRETPADDVLLYDLGRITDEDTAPREVSIPCAAFDPGAGDTAGRSIGYLARTLFQAGIYRDRPAAQRTAAAVATVTYQSYEDLLYRGLPMWPWELKVNGIFVPEDFSARAPRQQLIVLRPNVGMALLFEGDESSEADYALTVEPIGFVRYRSSAYDEWWGASLFVGLTDDNGKGYGAMFRWNDFTLGVARHDRTNADDENLLYVSVDLYKYILGENGRTANASAFLDRLRARIGAEAE